MGSSESSSQDKPLADVAEQLGAENLVRSLRSIRCPACGAMKKKRQTFCGDCYFKLPAQAQRDLYRGLEDGYESYVLRALRTLGVTRFILPDDAPGEWGSGSREGRP